MNREQRLSWLLEVLARTGRIDVETIAAEGGVSAATVRRDLDHLQAQQMLTRTHGGAVASSVAYDLPLRYKVARRATEKQRIGIAAAQLADGAAVIGLNGGTTTTEVARAVANRVGEPTPETRTRSALTIVTNALNIANELTVRPNVRIIVTGGAVRSQSYELVGPLASRSIADVNLDIAFIGVGGLSVVDGATADNEEEADINRLMAARAKRVVVVADSTKLGTRSFAHMCGLSDVHTLVTDSRVDGELASSFEAAGVKVLRA